MYLTTLNEGYVFSFNKLFMHINIQTYIDTKFGYDLHNSGCCQRQAHSNYFLLKNKASFVAKNIPHLIKALRMPPASLKNWTKRKIQYFNGEDL